jgi:multiple sugar transport system permease protein/putative aldouronate transport system permease protein
MDIPRRRGFFYRFSFSDGIFHLVCVSILAFAALVVFYPLWYCLMCSFSSTAAIVQGRVGVFPVEFSLNSYRAVFEYRLLISSFFNSLLYVAGGTSAAVILLLLAAYPLSRRDLPGRKFFQIYFLTIMFFNGGIIPGYILMRNLHLVGSRWALIVGFMFSCYNMIIVKTYFQSSLPPGLLDAARVDGCNDLYFFLRIAVPLSKPVVAVMVLFNAVSIWNSYFNGMLYLSRPETYNFQMVLRNILFVANMPPEMLSAMDPRQVENLNNLLQQLRYSVLIVGMLPMMLLYPFIQKYFVRGMMIGSLKE